MIWGALIGFIIIALFIFSVKKPNPDWGSLWYIRPLVIVPIAGALGSGFFHLKDFIAANTWWKSLLIWLFMIIAFVITLWIGIILGLDGTLWN